jgi:MarR family
VYRLAAEVSLTWAGGGNHADRRIREIYAIPSLHPVYVRLALTPNRRNAVTDFLEEKRREIDTQLAILKPQVDEYRRLEAATAALDAIPSASNGAIPAPRRRGPGQPPGSRSEASDAARASRPGRTNATGTKPSARRKAGRPKGGGERSLRTLAILTEQPGITIPEIASKMGIKQNYLYRVLRGLEAEGKVEKNGRGWHPMAQG